MSKVKRARWPFRGFAVLLVLLLLLVPAFSGAPWAEQTAYASYQVAEPFTAYYLEHQGERVLGYPVTALLQVQGEGQSYPAQYFEKARMEDHRSDGAAVAGNPAWRFMYGRLTAELMERDARGPVSGTDLTYGTITREADPGRRETPPEGYTGGVKGVHDGMFVPFDSQLRRARGYVVAPYFWAYINRPELFPAGWLHDIGLPMTGVFTAKVTRSGEVRTIFVQAFERAVLTYDMRNPAGWQVEKGNIGSDALRTLPNVPAVPTPTPGTHPTQGTIELPTADSSVVLPVHILARLGKPGEKVNATLRWQDGARLSDSFPVLKGEDGGGLVIGNLDWVNMLQRPDPRTQPATLEIRDSAGTLLARQERLTVLSSSDPGTKAVRLYWTVSGTETLQPQIRRIVKTGEQEALLTLEELLWGPPGISQVGFGTAMPTPQEVLSYPGRQSDWGPRVRLRGLNISGGVATADFSRELKAYGGGALRVTQIREQITQTLKQFSYIHEVRIAVEGQTEGVLEP